MSKPYVYQWDINNPKGYKNQMGFYRTSIEIDFIERMLRNNVRSIIDLGGGSGRLALHLIKKGFDVTLVDHNSEAVKIAKQSGIEKAYCSNLTDVEETGFDAALAIEVMLETNPESVIKKGEQVIRKGGYFIFVCANSCSWRVKLRSIIKPKSVHTLSPAEYEEILKRNNLKLIKIEGFMWMPFNVNSNNFLIPFFAKIEKMFFLRYWINQSPWLVYSVQKSL